VSIGLLTNSYKVHIVKLYNLCYQIDYDPTPLDFVVSYCFVDDDWFYWKEEKKEGR
jgi:hypothetical protein